MEAYVGADWSAREVTCSVGVGEQRVRRFGSTKRTLQGVRELIGRVKALDARISTVHVIIEAGASGWLPMFHHAGAVVHVADPKQSKAFAASVSSSGAKDDSRDADNLVAIGRSPRHCPPPWEPDDETHTQLTILSAMHESGTHLSGSTQQRLRSKLREEAPAFEAQLEDLSREWVLAFLKAVPTMWHAAQLTEDEIRRLLDGSGSRKTTRDKVVAALKASEAPWLTEAVARVQAIAIRSLVEQIELQERQVKEVEREMDALTANIDLRKQLETVGGIGPKMANRLLVHAFEEELQDRDQASIRLGASPVFRGSGKKKNGKPKGKAVMRRSAAPRARATTYLLGRLASQQLAWAKAMYAEGRKRGQGAATAYRRIARSLLRILTAMRRSGEAYDDARYVARLKQNGVPWARDLAAA